MPIVLLSFNQVLGAIGIYWVIGIVVLLIVGYILAKPVVDLLANILSEFMPIIGVIVRALFLMIIIELVANFLGYEVFGIIEKLNWFWNEIILDLPNVIGEFILNLLGGIISFVFNLIKDILSMLWNSLIEKLIDGIIKGIDKLKPWKWF